MPEQLLVTTTILLERLRDSRDEDAWRTFDERFRSVIIATALRLGLTPADAEDAAQETIFQALRDYQAGKYDRTRSRLSSWIISIAHHRIIDLHRSRRLRGTSGEAAQAAPAPEPTENAVADAFDEELERRIFEQAWNRLRSDSHFAPETITAFELAALRRVPPAQVAAQCGISVDQVYLAKNRVSARLRTLVDAISRTIRDGL